MSGDNIRFFRTRADLALDLANRPENSDLRDKYLGLWREWSDQADHARSRRESGAQAHVFEVCDDRQVLPGHRVTRH